MIILLTIITKGFFGYKSDTLHDGLKVLHFVAAGITSKSFMVEVKKHRIA